MGGSTVARFSQTRCTYVVVSHVVLVTGLCSTDDAAVVFEAHVCVSGMCTLQTHAVLEACSVSL